MNKLWKIPLIVFVLFFLIGILGINLVSALDFDNVKGNLIIDDTTSKYGKIDIYNWNVIGKLFDIKLSTLKLKENTDTCGNSCSMETEIIMYQYGVLIDDVRFIGYQVTDYQFLYSGWRKECWRTNK